MQSPPDKGDLGGLPETGHNTDSFVADNPLAGRAILVSAVRDRAAARKISTRPDGPVSTL